MDQLLQELQEKAGLSAEQAHKAVSVVTDFFASHASDEQLRAMVEKIPGLDQFSDKIPSGLGDKISDLAGGLFKKKD
ncbi:MAG TPA: hypothetical protein PK593_03025 [Thermomicrobiales bacterium]|jgi:hypothetical protein|nr:hypothetical protein [Chloroflexota bacterium]HQX62413.1 hypothetical protein [Thermomicrobiales bacterium]HBY46352.1 hypothetical protein [Chloroflexota bacterium]HCG28686.1 hypothetical protein [Chloroflexota bacterium]HQZ88982.1 hypothetical protein [Thermomicrobiales bacterium]